MNIRRLLLIAAAAALCVGSAHADGFPTKPITLIVPFPALVLPNR